MVLFLNKQIVTNFTLRPFSRQTPKITLFILHLGTAGKTQACLRGSLRPGRRSLFPPPPVEERKRRGSAARRGSPQLLRRGLRGRRAAGRARAGRTQAARGGRVWGGGIGSGWRHACAATRAPGGDGTRAGAPLPLAAVAAPYCR